MPQNWEEAWGQIKELPGCPGEQRKVELWVSERKHGECQVLKKERDPTPKRKT